ncbi:MAG: GNAT family N-acetyltransferase [Anaerolineales bacterium]|jgi:CelD/BcsL family acetyltransferase involved in cellulose biosynthesis
MQLQSCRSEAEWEALRQPWNHLLQASFANLPFLRFEFLREWWRSRGGGEWKQGELRLVIARQGGGLAAVAPFFRVPRDGRPSLMLLGSIEIADYLDLIATPQSLPVFCRELLGFLAQAASRDWEQLDLYNLRADSLAREALLLAAREQGWHVQQEELQPCPVIDLPSSWEAYLEGLDGKQRHEIRRKLRRAEGSDARFSWYIVDSGRNLEKETEAFLALMATDERKSAFLSEAMREQFHSLVRAAWEGGWLQLAFLEAEGEKAAGFLNFDYQNRIWLYNSGISPRYAALSPGWVLLAHLIRTAIERRYQAFDFMRGNESYKFQWGGISQPIYRLVLQPPAG